MKFTPISFCRFKWCDPTAERQISFISNVDLIGNETAVLIIFLYFKLNCLSKQSYHIKILAFGEWDRNQGSEKGLTLDTILIILMLDASGW